MRASSFLCFAVLLATLAAPSVQAAAAANPIHVTGCQPNPPQPTLRWIDVWGRPYYQPGVGGSLSISYVNNGSQPASAIEFGLVARGALVAEVRDVGTFSPGAPISHAFGLSPQVFPLGTALPRCIALRVKWADGTHWTNPALPRLNATR